MAAKQKSIVFRTDDEYLNMIDELAQKLGKDRSKAIRIAVNEAIEKYVRPGFAGGLLVLTAEDFEATVKSFQDENYMLRQENKNLKSIIESLKADDYLKELIEGMERSQKKFREDLLKCREEQWQKRLFSLVIPGRSNMVPAK